MEWAVSRLGHRRLVSSNQHWVQLEWGLVVRMLVNGEGSRVVWFGRKRLSR